MKRFIVYLLFAVFFITASGAYVFTNAKPAQAGVLILGSAALFFTVAIKTTEAGQTRHISNSARLINRGRYLVEGLVRTGKKGF